MDALLWAGYPSQSGGTAIVDILIGNRSPAGRLPVTSYPASYVDQIAMTDMALRPNSSGSPGRTYKWYTGAPVYPFGYGIHYTTFHLAWSGDTTTTYNIQDLVSAANLSVSSSGDGHIDTTLLDTFTLLVTNTGSNFTSDYVALLFTNSSAGPSPAPNQELVSYTRIPHITPGGTATAELNVTLGSIARVDTNGNWGLYPGTYNLWVGVDATGEVLRGRTIELTGSQENILDWPTPPWGETEVDGNGTDTGSGNVAVRTHDSRSSLGWYLGLLMVTLIASTFVVL